MAMTSCATCAKEISKEALACPHCGQPSPVVKPGVRALCAVLVLGLFVWWFLGGGLVSHAQDEMVEQALAQYQIASRSNDQVQACVYAGMVVAAYLQTKDEANYNQWLSIQKRDCKTTAAAN